MLKIAVLPSVALLGLFSLAACNDSSSPPHAESTATNSDVTSTTERPSDPAEPTLSELDKQLSTLIQRHALTGNPAQDRTIPDISEPLPQLGMRLFFSKALGGDKDAACVTCHHPQLGGGDDLPMSIGVGAELPDQLGPGRAHSAVAAHFDGGPPVPRNAPTTFNSALWDSVMFHDGRAESIGKTVAKNGNDGEGIRTPDTPFGVADPLAGADLPTAQARFPVTSQEEMLGFTFVSGGTTHAVRDALAGRLVDQSIPNTWLADFQAAFNSTAPAEELITYDRIAQAIGAYERSQLFIDNAWKHYIEGDLTALSDAAKAGARLFFTSVAEGGAGCADCHSGDTFTDEAFYVLAIPQIGRGKGNGETGTEDFGRFNESGDPLDKYAFRTPSLLNVEVTGPYGHDGAYLALEAMVRHHLNPALAIEHYDFTLSDMPPGIQKDHAETNTRAALDALLVLREAGHKTVQDVTLTDAQVQELMAFLYSLTDECVKDADCLAKWVPDRQSTGVDNLQLNAVKADGSLF